MGIDVFVEIDELTGAQGRALARHADAETNRVLCDVRALARAKTFGTVLRDVLIASLARGA